MEAASFLDHTFYLLKNFMKKVDYWIPFIYRPLFLLSPVHLMHPKIFLRDRCNH